jgi:hypothetical protein
MASVLNRLRMERGGEICKRMRTGPQIMNRQPNLRPQSLNLKFYAYRSEFDTDRRENATGFKKSNMGNRLKFKFNVGQKKFVLV